ncbi:MAG: head maturation protease, ClpP-related [Fusobacteriaceae bacterium]
MSVFKFEKNGKVAGNFEIKNVTEKKAELVIYGEIVTRAWDSSDVEPADVKKFLDEIEGKDLDIFINSPGGSVFAGITIYNMLKRHTGYKKVYIDGLAASIASVIAMAGDEINIPKNAYLMIHKAWGFVCGNADKFRENAEIFDRLDGTLKTIYLEKALEGITEEKFEELMKAETWLNGEDAKKYFKINILEEKDIAAAINSEICLNYKLPSELKIISNEKKENNLEKEKINIAKAKLLLTLEL